MPGATPPGGAPANGTPPVNTNPTEGEGGTEGGTEGETPEIAALRREAANYRTRLRAEEQARQVDQAARATDAAELQQLKDQMAKVAAVFNPEQPPDPAKLAEQLTQTQTDAARKAAEDAAKIRDLTIRAALPQAAAKATADLTQLGDSVSFMSTVAKLDPASATFAADLESAVSEAVAANPRLKIAQAAVRSGAEIHGRSGGSDQLTYEQIKGWPPEKINEAREKGQLRQLMGG